jgi:hypothetical protein
MVVSKQFIPISFSPGQLLDEDTLDQMVANEQFLRDQSVDGKVTTEWGSIWDTGIKMLCGRAMIPAQSASVVYGTVGFTSMFTPGSQPVIATGITSVAGNKFMHVIRGIGQVMPDHRGFQYQLNVRGVGDDNSSIGNTIYLNWIAMGV